MLYALYMYIYVLYYITYNILYYMQYEIICGIYLNSLWVMA